MKTPGKLDLAGEGFFSLVDLLEAAKTGLPEEVPSAVDAQFSELARAYRKSDPKLREQVREQIPSEYFQPLLQLSDRCAEWAMADKDPSHLEDGLTAYCLEDARFDSHENLVHLSRIWYAGKTLHANNEALFSEMGRLGGQASLQELSEFAMRSEEEKSPRSMGLEPYQDHGHIRFRPKRVKEKKAPPAK